MSIEKERELFLYELNGHGYHFKNTDWHDDWERFEDEQLNMVWEMWIASTNREGYKLVPLEVSWQKADELASKEWDKNKTMFCNENRDMSVLQVEEFRLRWCRNKAHQIMIDYKAMIGACDD